MSKSLHEALKEVATSTTKQQIINNALKEAAANVQTRVGSDIPVEYDINKGGTKADQKRLKSKLGRSSISRLSADLRKRIETMNEEDPHVSSDPSHPANQGGPSSGGGRMKAHPYVHTNPHTGSKVRHQLGHMSHPHPETGEKIATVGKMDTKTRGIPVRKPVADKSTTEATNFSERVLEAAYSPISRAARLGKVIAGRATQSAIEKDTDKRDKLMDKLYKARGKLIDQGSDHEIDRKMGDITRDRNNRNTIGFSK